ncbi:MAG: ornithine cyclodeaminase family protein [Deltaproteobacteria bacterium]|nr:ornithine cyclodeaminase family protein [Deltaproteobacteria bacterium]
MHHEFRYLSRGQVESLGMSMEEVIEVVEEVFRLKGEGRCEMPPKPGIHPESPDSFLHAMPGYVPDLCGAGIKWVSGFPVNRERGLPYICATLILNDPETGLPLAIMDGTWITAVRTGAATAVAARYLARPDSRVMGMLGCGVQGRSNLAALRVVLKEMDRVKAYDIDPEALRRYVEEMSGRHGIRVDPVESPKEAVEGADVIVTAGPILKNPEPVIQDDWIAPGAFGCALDYDSYWRADAFRGADRLFSDDVTQTEYARAHKGFFSSLPKSIIDFGDVVAGKVPGRQSPTERLLSLHQGLALEDMATAVRILRLAESKGVGTMLPL